LFADIQSYRRTYFCPECGDEATEALHRHVDTCPFIAHGLAGRTEPLPRATTGSADNATRKGVNDSRLFMECLAVRGARNPGNTIRMAIAFAASVVITVIMTLPLVPSIADLVRSEESHPTARAAKPEDTPLSAPTMTRGTAPSAGRAAVSRTGSGATRPLGPPDGARAETPSRAAHEGGVESPEPSGLAPPARSLVSVTQTNEGQVARSNGDRSVTVEPPCSLKSRVTGDLRKAFTLCPDERRRVEGVERFLDEMGDVAGRRTTELVGSIKRAASLTPNQRTRLEKLKRFFDELPDAPSPTDDRVRHGADGFQAK
jgi:hypothetical protein